MVYRRIQQEEIIWAIDVSNFIPITREGNMVYRRIQQEEVIWSIDVPKKRR